MLKKIFIPFLALLLVGCGNSSTKTLESGVKPYVANSSNKTNFSTLKENNGHEIEINKDNFEEFFQVTPGDVNSSSSSVSVSPSITSYRNGFVYFVGSFVIKGNAQRRVAQGTYPETYIYQDFPYTLTGTFNPMGGWTGNYEWTGSASEKPYKRDYNDTITHTVEVNSINIKAVYIDSGISGTDDLCYKSYSITEYNFQYYFAGSFNTNADIYSISPRESTTMYDYDVEITYNSGKIARLCRNGTLKIPGERTINIEKAIGKIDVYPGRVI